MPKTETETGFTPMFDPCYVQGYTAAIQDAMTVMYQLKTDMKRHNRKWNPASVHAILQTMLHGRTILRECPDAFIRCNDKAQGGFEIWREAWNKENGE